jgi:hypothetical protein
MTALLSAPADIDTDLMNLRNEFMAMPGLCLTVPQTARLLSVPEAMACALLAALVAEGLLIRTCCGLYRRCSIDSRSK